MNNSPLDDLLAKQTAAENAYYQAGSPQSGPIYDAYISALNAVDRLQTQIENTNYNTPGVEYKPAPVIVDEHGRITGTVPQPGGLTAVPANGQVANLAVQKRKTGLGPNDYSYFVIDADQGVEVASFSDPSIANSFASAGDASNAAIASAQKSDINATGGTQTTPAAQPGTSSNSSTVPVSSSSSSNNVTYVSTDDPEARAIFAQLKAQNAASRPQYTSQTIADPLYQGGTRTILVPVDQTKSSAAEVTNTPAATGSTYTITPPAGEITTDSLGNQFITLADGTSKLLKEAPTAQPVMGVETQPGEITTDSSGNQYITLADGTTQLVKDVKQADPVAGVETQPGQITTDSLGNQFITLSDGTTQLLTPVTQADPVVGVDTQPGEITTDSLGNQYITLADGTTQLLTPSPNNSNADQSGIKAQVNNAQNQPAINTTNRNVNNTDWRVRLSLANGADYLYSAADAASGILSPLRATNGIIFPYTPTISTSYKANYNSYDLTHSNYRGYFYQNSYTDSITVTAAFTAQNTQEANYLLAVIHFFRSVTKMFYGQSSHLGSPPPICYLNGLGEYQFNKHPVLVSQFNYSLPADVDYIRAGSSNNLQLNQNALRAKTNTLNPQLASVSRLATSVSSLYNTLFTTPPGAKPGITAPPVAQPLTNSPTYVPTKREIVLTLLPVQSRQQVSQVFNLDSFANGSQLTKGFW